MLERLLPVDLSAQSIVAPLWGREAMYFEKQNDLCEARKVYYERKMGIGWFIFVDLLL